MEFIVGLANYMLGNIGTVDLPNIAVNALEEGYDSPSLSILAGLGNDVWEIDEYLRLALKEMSIKLPDEKEAGLILMKFYIEQIIYKKIDPVEGIGKIISGVLRKTNCFDGKNKKYAFDYIGFHRLYGLYYDFDDMMNPLVCVSDKYRKKRIVKIKEEILIESAKFLKDYEIIRNKVQDRNV